MQSLKTSVALFSVLLLSAPSVFASAGHKDIKMTNTVNSVNTVTTAKDMKVSSVRSYTGGGSDDPCNYDASEEESALPEWDITFGVGSSFGSVNNDFDVVGVSYEANYTRLWLFANFEKEDLFMRTRLTHQHLEGKDNFNYLESDYFGLLLQPGYRLLNQDTQLVDLEVYALVELGHNSYSPGDDQWRLSPGVGFDVSRMTPVGNFTAGYTYFYSHNISGDDEITDSDSVNMQSTYVSWGVPLSKKISLCVDMQYTVADNLPSGMENDWLTASGKIMAQITDKVNFVVGYQESVSGGNGHAVTLGLNFAW